MDGPGPVCITFEVPSRQEAAHVLVKTKLADFRYMTPPGMKSKDILRCARNLLPALSATKLSRIRDPEVDKDLVKLEKDSVTTHYKFGLLYCAAGQVDENDMFCNGTLAPPFRRPH
jgi:hypothetical protein